MIRWMLDDPYKSGWIAVKYVRSILIYHQYPYLLSMNIYDVKTVSINIPERENLEEQVIRG